MSPPCSSSVSRPTAALLKQARPHQLQGVRSQLLEHAGGATEHGAAPAIPRLPFRALAQAAGRLVQLFGQLCVPVLAIQPCGMAEICGCLQRLALFAPGDAAAPTRITAIVVIAVLASDRYPPPLDAPSPACNLRGMETDARGCASGLLANPKGRTARPAEGRPPALVSARCDARRAPLESVRRAHPRDRRLGARRRCSTALVAVTTTTGRYLARESRIILHLGREKATSPRICGCQVTARHTAENDC